MTDPVVIAAIGVVGTIVGALFGAWDKVFKAKKASAESPTEHEILHVTFQQVQDLEKEIRHIFDRTTADRFLLLIAKSNGKVYDKVSVLYEQHATDKNSDILMLSTGAVTKYVNLDLDDDYRSMLASIRQQFPVHIRVNKMAHGMLRDLYLYEKVTASNIYFLYDLVSRSGTTITLFCSVAKHGAEEFKASEETYMKVAVTRIKNHIIPKQEIKEK
ncbi:hypothetical protein UFOVP1492_92 [uncultured Caudovirales phage]|uniref:Uncharacterized protein n=1 Tax=uncultured Caudovirales phage TaxID=2100421 RepID=A0A6J5R0K4_9CAUD|nr:hypothetical protein UFOVP1127_42 [uncultured Caudovirales phage]CAB4193159.1 hypothetical protein UFOVP1242_32 [uncultured Caudovirales phage]CAB4217797.1 hypothetical protein UFOVP1492_92 [uncultured Caudovirales phage]CAB5231620.1 hypothetical protein UFOVP1580_121 [uncultured Caudovirales phage]